MYKSHNVIVYADDVAVLVRGMKSLEALAARLTGTTEEMGLRVNVNTTKFMIIEANASTNYNTLEIGTEWGKECLEEIKDYIYMAH